MSDFTLADLAAIIAERARSGDRGLLYARSCSRDGVGRCAKKFGEEAVEAVLAAVGEDDAALTAEAADVLYHLLVMLEARGVPLAAVMAELEKRTAQSGLAEKAARKRKGRWMDQPAPARRLAAPRLHPRRMGEAPRRHAADADRRRPRAAEEPQRPDLARRGRRDLPAAVAPPQPLRRGDAGPARRDAHLPRHPRRRDALHHRHRRLGRGRQVDHGARPRARCSAAGRTRRRSS